MDSAAPGVSLGILVDHLLQKTYHDLTVLAELLPKKPDMERKIEIVKFASRSRQQFVRLLALVKWASAAERVDQCQEIISYLNQRALLFANSADRLHELAHVTLVSARLPNFSLPAAVDVLTTGSYPRLPACIKEKIVPEEPLTEEERKDTLCQLEAIIKQRLVASRLLPQLSNFTIANGRLTFTIKEEFEAALTVMGSDFDIPWRLLSLKILVSDPQRRHEILVSPSQIDFLHRLVQSRLFDQDAPLVEMYKCLHWFCTSLRLEVLHQQACRLVTESWRSALQIVSYAAGNALTVDYWKSSTPLAVCDGQAQSCSMHVSINVQSNDGLAQLDIRHTPALPTPDGVTAADERWQPVAIDFAFLSLEDVLGNALRLRSAVRLEKLFGNLSRCGVYGRTSRLNLEHLYLTIMLYGEDGKDELRVEIDPRNGLFRVQLLPRDSLGLVTKHELAKLLNSPSWDELPIRLDRLRRCVVLNTCQKLLSSNSLLVHSHLPLLNTSHHSLSKLSPNRLYVSLPHHGSYYLVVEVQTKKDGEKSSDSGIDISCYLLETTSSKWLSSSGAGPVQSPAAKDGPFLLAGSLTPLDNGVLIGQPENMEDCRLATGPSRKIPCRTVDGFEVPEFRVGTAQVSMPRLVPDVRWLSRSVMLAEHWLSLAQLSSQLTQLGFWLDGIHVEEGLGGLVTTITKCPSPAGYNPEVNARLCETFSGCTLRWQPSHSGFSAEFSFSHCPLNPILPSQAGPTRSIPISFQPQRNGGTPQDPMSNIAAQILVSWQTILFLYGPVLELSAYLEDKSLPTYNQCRVVSFLYNRLTLAYGPRFRFQVSVSPDLRRSAFRLDFGVCTKRIQRLCNAQSLPGHRPETSMLIGSSSEHNPHAILIERIMNKLMMTQSLPLLIHGLHHTLTPLLSLSHLYSPPQLGLAHNAQTPVKMLSITGQSPSSVLITYRGTFMFEVQMKTDNCVSIRDCAYSVLTGSKMQSANRSMHTFSTAIPHLKEFLLNFFDKHHQQVLAAQHTAPRLSSSAVTIAAAQSAVLASSSNSIDLAALNDMNASQTPLTEDVAIAETVAATPQQIDSVGGDSSVDRPRSNDTVSLETFDMLMRNLPSNSSLNVDSPLPPPDSVGTSLEALTGAGLDGDMGTPGHLFSPPSYAPGQSPAAPSPATLRTMTGKMPPSTNSPANLPWQESQSSDAALSVDSGGYETWSASMGSWPLSEQAPTVDVRDATGLPSVTTTLDMHTDVQASQGSESTAVPPDSGVIINVPSATPIASTTEPVVPLPVGHESALRTPTASLLAKQKVASQGIWHVSSPTLMTHAVFHKLLQPVVINPEDFYGGSSSSVKDSQDSAFGSQGSESVCLDHPFEVSPLEGFLGSTTLRNHWLRIINEQDSGLKILSMEGTAIWTRIGEWLKCRLWLDLDRPSLLQIQLGLREEAAAGPNVTRSEMQVLEKFFYQEVAGFPYRCNALTAYARLLKLDLPILRDMVEVICMQMNPSSEWSWRPHLCMTIPPNVHASPVAVPGQAAIAIRAKLLVFIKLVPCEVQSSMATLLGDDTTRPQSIVVSLLYNPVTKSTDPLDLTAQAPKGGRAQSIPQYTRLSSSAVAEAMSQWHLKFPPQDSGKPTISSAVRYLCANLRIRTGAQTL